METNQLVTYDIVTGKIKDAKTEQMIDHLFTTMKTQGLWETLAKLIQGWERTHPQEALEFYQTLKRTRDSRRNTDFATDKSKSTRYLAEIPIRINTAVNVLIPDIVFHNAGYKNRDSREFLIEFARKFPQFRVGKKL
jgi:hypothetical protein